MPRRGRQSGVSLRAPRPAAPGATPGEWRFSRSVYLGWLKTHRASKPPPLHHVKFMLNLSFTYIQIRNLKGTWISKSPYCHHSPWPSKSGFSPAASKPCLPPCSWAVVILPPPLRCMDLRAFLSSPAVGRVLWDQEGGLPHWSAL